MKVLKTTPNSSDMVIAGTGYSQITSGPVSVTASSDSGIYLNGAVSFTAAPDNIKLSGIFKFNPILASCLPSTMITPIPTLVMDMPIKNLSSMSAISTLLKGLL
jgi:hypothetical protein